MLYPRLSAQVQIHQRRFRGRSWYVLQERIGGRFHRLSPEAYALVAMMDGRSRVQAIWQHAQSSGSHPPSQDELVQLLSQLHALDMLQMEGSPDVAELLERFRKQRRIKLRQGWDPLGLRWSLWDPDPFLERCSPWLSWLWGPWGGLLWCMTVIPAMMIALQHADALRASFSDQLLGAQNLLALWLIYPVVKLLHELGHGLATKAGGGRVHDLGIMLLVMTPVPYVDATASYAFAGKWRRAGVAAAGVLVETWLAALALYLWCASEPGLLHAAAYDVMLIAGVSTVVVNGNPLLRYDGYHALCDVLEMPNLALRSSRYWLYLVDRYLFRAMQLEVPDETRGERFWLGLYGPASALYRMVIMVALIGFIAGRYFFMGVLLALWTAAAMLIGPLIKAWRHVRYADSLLRVRDRAYRTSLVGVGVLILLGVVLPLPFYSRAEGVLWLPEAQIVRAQESGFVATTWVAPGDDVSQGEVLLRLRAPELEADAAQQKARMTELAARYRDALQDSPIQAQVMAAQWREAEEQWQQDDLRVQALSVRSAAAGRFFMPHSDALVGHYYKHGDVIGYIDRREEQPVVRVVVDQDDIDLLRARCRAVEIRPVFAVANTVRASLMREVPLGQDRIPSKGLGSEGGGTIVVDPRDREGTRSLHRYFQVDVLWPQTMPHPWYGSRVYVRFDYGTASLGYRGYLRLRQLFLAHFNV